MQNYIKNPDIINTHDDLEIKGMLAKEIEVLDMLRKFRIGKKYLTKIYSSKFVYETSSYDAL